MKRPTSRLFWILAISPLTSVCLAGLETGEQINLTIRGVEPVEQQKISGVYRVGESGGIRLPLLDEPLTARGLSPEQFARAAEVAYKNAGIYSRPAIEVETVKGGDQLSVAVVSVAGQVRRAGEVPFRKGMTVIQAIDSVGGRNEFGGRNVLLLRDRKQVYLDFNNLAHKNIVLRPNDSLQVDQKAVIERWKGSEAAVKALME
jgi:protein involved in polysaccharide export with SLBB domain